MFFQKKKGGTHTFISPRVRSDPLRLLGSDVTGDQSEGNELTFVTACTPYLGFWRSLCDRWLGLPEPPRVVGIWSRVGLFRNIHPVCNSSQFRGIGVVSFASVA